MLVIKLLIPEIFLSISIFSLSMIGVFIKNSFEEPIEDNFKVYLVNYETKKIEEQFEIKTNNTNCIEINT